MFYKIIPVSSLSYYLAKEECVSTKPRFSVAGDKVLLRFNRKISGSYKSLKDIVQDLQGPEWNNEE